jgi:HEAT repeat protein
VVPALITALSDGNVEVRKSAAQALEQIGPAAVEAVPTLIAALRDSNQDVINAAKAALKRIRPVPPAANSA